MELVYLWVEDYKNIKKQGFNFSPKFECKYDDVTHELTINEKEHIKDFFGKNINVTAIVGENGSGKSSLITYLSLLSKNISKNIFACVLKKDKLEVQIYNKFEDFKVINQTLLEYNKLKFEKDKDNNAPQSRMFLKKDFIYYSMSHLDLNAVFQLNDDFYYLGPLNKELMFNLNEYNNLLNENIIYLLKQDRTKIDSLFKKLKIKLPHNVLAVPKNLFSNMSDEIIMTGEFSYLSFSDVLNKLFEYKFNILYGGDADKKVWKQKVKKFIDILKDLQFRYKHPIKEEFLYIQFFIKDIFNLYEEQKQSQKIIYKEKFEKLIESINVGNNAIKELNKFYKNTTIEEYINELMNLFNHDHFQDPQKHYLMNIGNYPNFTLNTFPFKLMEKLKKDNYMDIFRFSFFDDAKRYIEYSSGEIVMFDLISRLFKLKQEDKLKKNVVFLIDEMEVFLHPSWQKKYFNNLLFIIKELFNDKVLDLYITTHSPFILSDLPKENVIFLKDGKQINVDLNPFGANIHTLLSHGFFMKDGLMGEFAKSKIEDVINYLNDKESTIKDNDEAQKLLNIIGEPVIKNQLQKMLDSKRLSKMDKIDKLEEELELIKHRIEMIRKNQ